MSARTDIVRVRVLPEGFDALVESSVTAGLGFVERLRSAYLSGKNDFTRPGEGLWVARDGDRVVGVCGLNRDPYTDDSGVGRVRHLFVHPDYRRRGAGRGLVQVVIEHSPEHFTLLRLRTHSPEADRFYRALGFAPSDVDPYGTHVLTL